MGPSAALDITIRELTKAYGPVRALDAVDLDIRAGEFLTLLGPSGSGKTTLLMALAGFLRPDRGSIRFGGREVVRLAPHKRDIGMVFQNYALFPHMDVAANIAFPLKLRRVAAAEIARRVEAALAMVQLGGYGPRRIDQLSGGQRQRVALARAIVFEPRIVLMDEPLSALDKQLREAMQIEIRQLHEKIGSTTVYVTHDQREALTMSDRVAVVNHGRIIQIGAPRDIYERPNSRFVAEFIGESSFLPVERRDGVWHHGGTALTVATEPAGSGRHVLMIRPERLQLIGEGDGAGDHAGRSLNRFGGVLANVVYQGDTILMQVRLADGTPLQLRQTARTFGAALPERGAAVRLGLAPEDTVLIAEDREGAR
ncbi:polyamine ABC transporter ATP-binding protein [Prosthecomicrobium hirschii]|uniref:ABC transporter ATP-binding protein n=1 Tax=Prosthecodimorpha hirschii TaxID=665126 RepID=UPI00112E46BC|nr:ABC transporter ATP-binding protein [Prosthecomicrobium hirschii]TPQ50626.1 polyamine ABC transporter ATP-binding protein [Prosthecomicrobium hirschii]